MIVGTGIDLVETARIAQAIDRYHARFLGRIYLPGEIAYCQRKRNSAERHWHPARGRLDGH
jgi:holo-[acyl-carrier protein] synthase